MSQILSSPSFPSRLPRSLSSLETWGFGLTGLLLWLGVAPAMQLELGWQALWVWLPGAVVGILINLQVQRLGEVWSDLAGGTPSYIGRLLPDLPWLATYAAFGYYLSWVAVLPVNAIVLADLVQANLVPFGVACPTWVLQIGFTAIAFIVCFSAAPVALGGTAPVFCGTCDFFAAGVLPAGDWLAGSWRRQYHDPD
ncbi:MAG: hypothetical protein HC886_09840 [Leptolyngbyaceae cyanobacterium SM1_1_3]|nr:hypothetical protein [Leptolyngbyaceae cyanobacterium SM1_1_3]